MDERIEKTAKALLAADKFQRFDFRNWDTLPDAGYAHPPIRGRDAYRDMARAAIAADAETLDNVYRERNALVAALSTQYPSFIGKHDGDEHWEMEWLIVYVNLPTGQVSWHTHASDLDLFDHLERREGDHWDGHTTEEKYERLSNLLHVQNNIPVIIHDTTRVHTLEDIKLDYITLTHENVWEGKNG